MGIDDAGVVYATGNERESGKRKENAKMAESAIQISSGRTAAIQRQQESSELFKPTSFAEALEFAKVLADSGMVPKSYAGKPAAIIATWQHGLELGVGLMQALQGISNINGNPSVFGDLGWALVQNHPDFVDSIEEITDTYAVCTLKRRGRTDKTWKYTIEMAKQNDLLTKDNWKKNPKRMLQWRARSWCMRDQFPDSLKGMVIYEEAQDYPGPTIDGNPPPAEAVGQQVEQKKPEPEKTIGRGKATEFYKCYRSNGWSVEESKVFLKDTFGIELPKNSADIPESGEAKAFQWASTKAPVRIDAEKAMYDLLGFTEEEGKAFCEQRKGEWPKILEDAKLELDKRNANER
jgi:hypothetical protein